MSAPIALKPVSKWHSIMHASDLTWPFTKTNSNDQIIPVTVSQTTGFQNIMINAGEIQNKGIEFTLMPHRSSRIISGGIYPELVEEYERGNSIIPGNYKSSPELS